MVVVVRFLDGWEIKQRLVRLQTVSKPVSGPDPAALLNQCLIVDRRIRGTSVIATMREGTVVNGAAQRRLEFTLPNNLDITCFSHTMYDQQCRKAFQLPHLGLFHPTMELTTYSHSCKSKLVWKQRTGKYIA